VLLVDRSDETREELRALLAAEGYVVKVAADWHQGREWLRAYSFDAIVLCDWRKLGGRGAYRYLTGVGGRLPFVMVCDGGVTPWDERFASVLQYPVSGGRLSEAIREAIAGAPSPLRYAGLRLDERTHTLCYRGTRVRLTATETKIMARLMRSGGEFVGVPDLMARVWGVDIIDKRLLYTHICWLRAKLRRAFGKGRWVVNTRGLGYRLESDMLEGLAGTRGDE